MWPAKQTTRLAMISRQPLNGVGGQGLCTSFWKVGLLSHGHLKHKKQKEQEVEQGEEKNGPSWVDQSRGGGPAGPTAEFESDLGTFPIITCSKFSGVQSVTSLIFLPHNLPKVSVLWFLLHMELRNVIFALDFAQLPRRDSITFISAHAYNNLWPALPFHDPWTLLSSSASSSSSTSIIIIVIITFIKRSITWVSRLQAWASPITEQIVIFQHGDRFLAAA